MIVTNHRILFAGKTGSLSKDYALSYGINLEDVMGVSHGKHGFNDKLVILEKNGHHRDFIKPQIQTLIPTINKMMAKRIDELQALKDKERVQIMLDFTSLRDLLSKGGIVMTTFKCPNCGDMHNIPETGKILMCEHCGTPVKPVDIFERIKSLF